MTVEAGASRPLVLVADDDATARGITRAVLEDAGFEVVDAADGVEALAAFDRRVPDMVLLDVEMPRLDGLAVCRTLRERRDARHVPIVMATGLDDMGSIDAAYAAGATDFISKPINWALLRHRMRYVLRASQAALDLGTSEEKFRLITESSSDFIALLDRDGRRLYSSPSYREVFGSVDLAGSDSFREIHPEDREAIRELFLETVDSGVGREARFRWILGDDRVRHLESRGNVIRGNDGKVERVVVVSRDVTERTLQDQKIQRLSRIGAVLSGINSAIVRIRERAPLLEEACRIAVEQGHFAFAWIGLVDAGTGDILPVAWKGAEQGFLAAGSFRTRDDGGPSLGMRAIRSRRPVVSNDIANDKELRHGAQALARGFRSVVGLPLVVAGEVEGILLLYSSAPGFFDDEEMRLLEELAGDISFGLEHIEKEREVHHLAYYDPLTGLPNRRLFQETLATLTESRPGARLAVVVIDVRGFHVVNDNLGRHTGDALLKLVAQRLRASIGSADTLGRLGGDQFGLILTDIAHEASIGNVLERICGALRAPFQVDAEAVRLSVKAGASVFPSETDGSTADALLTNAESALKKAKGSPETYQFYGPHLNVAIANRVALENALERALEAREFVLLYQPKVDFRSGITTGMEALLYWNHPRNGLTSPVKFIGVLEETGLIVEVGRWVVRQAMADLEALRSRGHGALRIAVNVSPLQFRQKDFPGYLAAAMGEVRGAGLDIEITESVMMDDIESCIDVLWRVREMGVGVALDDFGTGYSSLSYIARLPATTLKIDRSFVAEMATNAGRQAIVSTVIALAHALGMKVVAEGVETPEQARVLRGLHCDEVQGYLYGRPAPLAQAERFLEVPFTL